MSWRDWMDPYRVVMHPLATEGALAEAMRHEDAGVRAWAAVNPSATERVQLIAARDPDVMVPRALVEHLAWLVRTHRPVAVEVLRVLASDQDERVRDIADRALYWMRIA
jgi:hypothetical protein